VALEVKEQLRMTDFSTASSSSAGNVLSVEIRKQFAASGGNFSLNAAFEVPAGITILFGASGAGKTTLLDCIAGLVTPDSGRIEVGKQKLLDLERAANLAPQERRIGYVFQDLALFPHLNVKKNIEYGLQSLGRSERQRRSDALMGAFRISNLRDRKPAEISGGERQRVALARALVTDPCLLLLDEPMAALDASTKSKIIEDLRAWNNDHHIPILYVTHSREEVFALGERVLVLENGRIIAQGTPHEVMSAPRQETVAQLSGFENIFDVTVVAIHENRGTMTCRITGSDVELETPMVRADVGSSLRVGIRAGDILLATVQPSGLSARNIIRGTMISLEQHDVVVVATVDCGVEVAIHLTLAARDSLRLRPGSQVWLVVKTYSCHLMLK
jgi:molybdate transport system ATP-binding protein